MAILKAKASDPLPPGTYLAKIVDISEAQGNYGKPVLKLTFELIDFDHLGRRLTKIVSATLSKKSKLGGLASALFGDEVLRAGAEFDTVKLIGQLFKLNVTQERRDDGSTFNVISDIQVPDVPE